MGEVTKMEVLEDAEISRSPLLPDRHPTGDLFVCDIFDAAPKGDIASMEHPIFSLSTKPDLRIRRYDHGDKFVEITPSVKGLATVHDRDILIFCISQIMAGIKAGRKIDQTIRLKAHDVLVATNRAISGEGYDGLHAALERLKGTQIKTNIITGQFEVMEGFGLIDKYRVVRLKDGEPVREGGRLQTIEIKLSDWVFNAIQANEVLTLHRDYFRLRKPLERRMYELARKHTGTKDSWTISLALMQKKCGSNSTSREFRRLVKTIVDQDTEHGHFPDYSITMTETQVTFTNRRNAKERAKKASGKLPNPDLFSVNPMMNPDVYDKARQAAPGYDVQTLYREWLEWSADKGEATSAEGAFIGFCRSRHARSPLR